MQKKEIIEGLVKIGLNEKEARVYLAALELGEATAQQIAAKATVNRPSTYIAIESLILRGMMSSFQKGKKRYFSAGKPRQLAYIIEQAKQTVLEKETAVGELIRSLDNYKEDEKKELSILAFEGFEGMRAWQMDILSSDASDFYEIFDLDRARNFIPARAPEDIRDKIRAKFRGHLHTIYTAEKGQVLDSPKGSDVTYLNRKQFPFQNEIVIYGDTTVFYIYGQESKGVMITNRALADNMRIIFNLLKTQE